MRKQLAMMVLATVFLLGMISTGNTTQITDLIDNINIIAIKSISVKSNTLTLVTEIKNSTNQVLRLTEGNFTFYLRINKSADEKITKDEMLGTDNPSKILLQTEAYLIDTEGKSANEITFDIDLGKEQKKVFRSFERIINALGNPSKTHPIFYINGGFYLGTKSKKGWVSSKAKIYWVFRPELQERLLLEASPELHEGIRSKPSSGSQKESASEPSSGSQKESASKPSSDSQESASKPSSDSQGASASKLPPDSQEQTLSDPSSSILSPDFPKTEKEIEDKITENCRVFVNVHFKFDSDEILPASHSILERHTNVMKSSQFANMVFTVAGHACELGTAEYNMDLSKRRAIAVKEYLKKNFEIPDERLNIEAYGETKRIDFTDTELGRSKNRRVEFICQECCEDGKTNFSSQTFPRK